MQAGRTPLHGDGGLSSPQKRRRTAHGGGAADAGACRGAGEGRPGLAGNRYGGRGKIRAGTSVRPLPPRPFSKRANARNHGHRFPFHDAACAGRGDGRHRNGGMIRWHTAEEPLPPRTRFCRALTLTL
ncbi:hypothetical protein B5F35_06035 [Anaeromassilibacillus sp. An200]|nr:hypothetical protein B5F35_06035 [Anaeromassilibacillus sp. An200]